MIAAMVLAAALADAPPSSAPDPAVEAVVVTARKPIAGDLQKGVVDYRPEFFTPIRPASALDMVNWLPGFVFEDTRDMRGLEGSTGNVLIDGRPPTSKTDTLTSVLRRIPTEQVERVDLIVGAAPGIDMHGRSVIANVILKPHDKPAKVVTATVHVDTHGQVGPDIVATYNSKGGGRTLDASLQITRNTVIYPTYGYGPWVRRDATGAVQFAADERFTYDGPYVAGNAAYEFPLAGGKLRVNGLLRLTHETLDEYDQLTTAPGAYGYRNDDSYGEGELGLRYERAFGRLELEAQALERYRQLWADERTWKPPLPEADRIGSHLAEHIERSVLRYKPNGALTVEGSAEHTLNDSFSLTTATQNGAPIVLPVGRVDLIEDRWDGGVSATWKPNGAFSLDAALKAETFRLHATGDETVDRALAYPKPRLALTWSPDKDSQIRLRAEYEVQQIPLGAIITFNQYQSGLIRAGNADLRPPRAAVAEAVFERHFWSTGDLTVTARYQALEDMLDDAPRLDASGALYSIVDNVGGGHETDLIGNLMVPLKRLGLASSTLRAVVTWQRARITDPVSGQLRARSNYPEMQQELHFAQDLARWKFNWGIDAFYRGGTTFYRPFGDQATDAWTHVNVFIERRFGKASSLRLEIQNLPGEAPKGTVSVFSGLRDRSALLYVDEKRLSVGPLLLVRLRKTL